MEIQASSSNNSLQHKQRLIRLLQEEVEILKSSKKQIQEELDRVKTEKYHYQTIVKNDPLYMILNSEINLGRREIHLMPSYQQLEARCELYHQQTIELKRQVLELRKSLLQRQNQIKLSHQRIIGMEELIHDFKRQKNMLEQQKDCAIRTRAQYAKTAQQYQSRLSQFSQDIHSIKAKFSQNGAGQLHILTDLKNTIDALKATWTRSSNLVMNENEEKNLTESEKLRELNQKFKQQSEIMEEMGRDLDARTEQITQMMKKDSFSSEERTSFNLDQHTLMEIVNSNSMKEKKYRDLLEKFRQMQRSLDQSLKEKLKLEQQYIVIQRQLESTRNLTETNKKLRQSEETLKSKLESTNKYIQTIIPILEDTMNENDVFYNFMLQQHGSKVYQDKIDEERKKYQMRKGQRQAKQVWANSTELIEMNRKLREKLAKRH